MVKRGESDSASEHHSTSTDSVETHRRIEIVHESLLSAWPRLARWRAQDVDGARLRDDLRHAATMWHQHDRSDDYLWTGTAFREFHLWRERYSGGLTEIEESFAGAMTRHALKRKRHRRIVLAVVIGSLLAGLVAVGLSRQQAVAAARRAEASKLLALAQLEIDRYPTRALAYATKGLELDDRPETRQFALRALAVGPPATLLAAEDRTDNPMSRARFSDDGEWMVLEGNRELAVLDRDGRTLRQLGSFPSTSGLVASCFSFEGDRLLAFKGGELGVWNVPGFEESRRREIVASEMNFSFDLWRTKNGYFAVGGSGPDQLMTRLMPNGDSATTRRVAGFGSHVDPQGQLLAMVGADRRRVVVQPFDDPEAPVRLVGELDGAVGMVRFGPNGHRIAASDSSGHVHLWPLDPSAGEASRVLSGARGSALQFDSEGDRLATWTKTADGYLAEIWDLRHPEGAEPLRILSPGPSGDEDPAFSPDGLWLTTNHVAGRALWPLSHPYPIVLALPEGVIYGRDVAFLPDGTGLVSTAAGEIRLWDLAAGGRARILASELAGLRRLAVDPGGRFVAVAKGSEILVVPFDGGPIRSLEGATQFNWEVAVDAEGRRAATASGRGTPETKVIRIWDQGTGEMTILGPTPEMAQGRTGVQSDFAFLPAGGMVSVGDGGLRLWDIETNTSTVVAESSRESKLTVFGEGRFVAYTQGEEFVVAITDLAEGTTRRVPSHAGAYPIAVDEAGTILVTGGQDGILRVGPISGEPPHLLIGHTGMVRGVALSPGGRRIASIGEDHTIRLWETPDVSRPPLHTWPRDALLAKLRSLTNLRAVEDPLSSTGWRLDLDPFPGWRRSPDW